MIIVTYFLYKFTNNYYDRRTGQNIVDLEKKSAKININSVNALLTTTLLKIQASINELIIFYQKLANRADNITNFNLNDFLKGVLDLNDDYLNKNKDLLKYKAIWFLNNYTSINNITNIEIKKELIVFSNIIQNVYSTLAATKSSIGCYIIYFEKTELFISFPLEYYIVNKYLSIFKEYTINPPWCLDSNGKPISIYKFKCRDIYINTKKAQAGIFDNNKSTLKDRSIYISNSYRQFGIEDNYTTIFTMCIQFEDPITGGLGYFMADIYQDDLLFAFDNFNAKLSGYYLITSVGFNNVFYYPQMTDSVATPTENIFRWNRNFYLQEKTNFMNNIQKIITSNYNNYLNSNSTNSLFDEIKINGENTSEQYFYFNGDKFYYSLYPVFLENINGKKEHVLSIVYLYNNQLYYNRLKTYQSNTSLKIILEIIIFTVFGSGLLYLVVLSFNTLAKYIVIPIKNVNYMLKGIHIGGENRLEYLDFLKKRQDDNLEKLEKLYYSGIEKKNKNENNEDTDNHILKDDNIDDGNKNKNDLNKNYGFQEEAPLMKNNNDYIEQENQNINDMEYNGEIFNPKEDYNKKYDKESDYIEKETNFYDFDEELLQYRPLEIDRLVKVLLDLKGALLLTSTDHQVEQIINYSYSEEIFRNFKNKEGTTICQSNIGNLQSQLLKFDKAIYHLALSLQDDKLKRFLSRTLSDELDESDTLLHKISLSYNKDKDKEKINILAEKQQNSSRDNFSQKLIGILINSRYCKLINVYFKFFSFMQKSNIEMLSGQFMNTNFHTINYYHKIIIQYIYLSYVKNDLIKIGESILDYIEFLIKFKFKTSSDNKYLLNIHNRERLECKDKQKYKKKIFDKILSWFNLFDNYASHVRDNSSLGDDKSIVDDYSHSLNSANSELNSSSQSVFLFRVNIQRGDFLKGKFALACNNYNDALFFFIRAAKKKSIVLDGLIQKKALKHIFKISEKLAKNLEKYGIINLSSNKKLIEFDKIKNRSLSKKSQNFDRSNTIINDGKSSEIKPEITFRGEMENIKGEILKDISECNIKQAKDIIILIDFNVYDQELNNNNSNKTEAFIDQTKTILNNYLSSNDRLGVFIFTKQYKIVCPLMCKNKIDINNFCKDLIYYKKKFFNEIDDTEEYDVDVDENDFLNEKIEFQSNNDNFSEPRSQEDSFDEDDKKISNLNKISGLIKSINYIKTYLKMKEAVKNEKYIILFTDLFNYFNISDEEIEKKFESLVKDKEIHFLLVGKNRMRNIKNETEKSLDEDNEKRMYEIITEKFGDKSELIDFENMKKIQTILASNNVIKDEIIYPNEIYK